MQWIYTMTAGKADNWRHPKYPVYVISKGRWEHPYTIRALQRMGVWFYLVIEPCELHHYRPLVDDDQILLLPFNNAGCSIPARNFAWEHSISRGYERHWILDDNIRNFYYVHKNVKWRVKSGFTFRLIEEFVDRYENIAMAGMQYEMFFPRRFRRPPFSWNKRIYSCILIKNDIPMRWRGKYNEDTDLSLRVLKAGYVTVLFYAFVAEKIATMRLKGGNTDALYKKGKGRTKMAIALAMQHPDVTTITYRWHRYQHEVDYSPFANNMPILKKDASPLNIGEHIVKFHVNERTGGERGKVAD